MPPEEPDSMAIAFALAVAATLGLGWLVQDMLAGPVTRPVLDDIALAMGLGEEIEAQLAREGCRHHRQSIARLPAEGWICAVTVAPAAHPPVAIRLDLSRPEDLDAIRGAGRVLGRTALLMPGRLLADRASGLLPKLLAMPALSALLWIGAGGLRRGLAARRHRPAGRRRP